MLDLARVQKLHNAAIAAGLPGVLPANYEVRNLELWHRWGDNSEDDALAEPAVAWLLREWCWTNTDDDPEYAGGDYRDPNHFLTWAEEIVAARKTP